MSLSPSGMRASDVFLLPVQDIVDRTLALLVPLALGIPLDRPLLSLDGKPTSIKLSGKFPVQSKPATLLGPQVYNIFPQAWGVAVNVGLVPPGPFNPELFRCFENATLSGGDHRYSNVTLRIGSACALSVNETGDIFQPQPAADSDDDSKDSADDGAHTTSQRPLQRASVAAPARTRGRRDAVSAAPAVRGRQARAPRSRTSTSASPMQRPGSSSSNDSSGLRRRRSSRGKAAFKAPRGRASVSARRRGSSSSIEDRTSAPTLSQRAGSVLDHANGGDSDRSEEDRTTRPTVRRSDRIQAASDDRKRRRPLSVTLSPRTSRGGAVQRMTRRRKLQQEAQEAARVAQTRSVNRV